MSRLITLNLKSIVVGFFFVFFVVSLSSQAAVWVSGSEIAIQNGVYGTKGVADSNNVPGGREWCVTWIDSGGSLWLFGGIEYYKSGYSWYLLNDLWKFDGTNWTWVSGASTVNQVGVYGTKGVPAPENRPGAREGGLSWIDSSNNLWLFGGHGRDVSSDSFLNDLWKFNGAEWTWVSGSSTGNQAGIYGIKGVANSNNVPGAREYSISWLDSSGNMWLFGGYGYASGQWLWLNDLWKFDGTMWTWVSGSNTAGQAGVYGTKGVAASENVPWARDASVSWIDSNDNLWLFGGANSSGSLNDLWKFDGTMWTWVSGSNIINQSGVYGVKGITDSNSVPGARHGAVSWIDSNDNLWLFGGFGYASNGGYLNDLWKFDGSNWTWISGSKNVNQAGVYGTEGVLGIGHFPSGRYGTASWLDSSGNLWIFGGNGYDSNGTYGRLNDLWKFVKGPLGDLNLDKRVDFSDIALLASQWLNSCSSPTWCNGYDLNNSGQVDLTNLFIIISNWLVDCNANPSSAACVPQ